MKEVLPIIENDASRIADLCQKEGITTLSHFFKERDIPFPSGLLIPLVDAHEEVSLKQVEEWYGGSDANARGITKNLDSYIEGVYSQKSITPKGTQLSTELREIFGAQVQEVLQTKDDEEITAILPAIYQGLLEIHKQRMKTKVGQSGRKAESPLLKWLQLSLFDEKKLSQTKFGDICGFSYVTAHTKIHRWEEEKLLKYSSIGRKTTVTANGKRFITLQRKKLTQILMASEEAIKITEN